MLFSNSKSKGLALAALGAVLLGASFIFFADRSLAAPKEKAAITAKVDKAAKAAKNVKAPDINNVSKEATALQAAPAIKAHLSPWEEALNQRLTALLQHDLFQRSQLGMIVYDLTSEKVVFQHQQLLRPASTMKSLVALTALDKLSSYYQFHTKLAYDGTITDGVLTGNIYCIGGFDPLFDSRDMQAFVRSV